MYERFAEAIVIAAYSYVCVGVLVAVAIVSRLGRLDSEAQEAGLGFRAIVFPGVVALWPCLLRRFVLGTGEAPIQKDPHR